MTKFKSLRIGHAGSKHQRRDDCSTGGLYKSPTKGQTVDATQALSVSWDASCFSSDVNLYLYGYGVTGNTLLQTWKGIPASSGSHSVNLNPSWWNNNSTASLQFTIAPSDTLIFLIDTPAGPVFTATYSGTATSAAASQNTAAVGAVQQVASGAKENHSTSKGGVAAAVLVPLLLLIGLAVAAYIRIARQKRKEKQKRFSEMVDKRMSTISTDWKSLSGAGANAAIRNSMAVSGNRASSFSFGGIRPSSTVAEDGGHAGVGAAGGMPGEAPAMSQLRPGLRTSAFENRTSRVSFAADTRPSSEYRRTRAFHTGYVPPLPEREASTESSSNASPILSPVQTAGALSLTPEDIRSRMAGQEARPSIDEVMPALTMMRTGAGELLFDSQIPTPPTPTYQTAHTPKSPVMGVMPMQPMPASVMSPDDMLRAYAERRAMGGAAPSGTPAPAANYNGNGMRVLYSPETAAPSSPDSFYPASTAPTRKSFAPTEHSKYDEDEEDAYGGTAQ
ncbi:uncharacterized protein BXZ73DRAFT_99095 [Epithele typhae]|uniref:uncharacterized protein n=1 Tax=Epithele typhae TaxID=378194 RepID=UPI0020081F50|nr:uncharacterized protein BXZ73DRAFT_99095 [Epithele typhae]KAH9940094.1 hypothetical protein BXZ73DRAFT_99095 [Epithele typhae]